MTDRICDKIKLSEIYDRKGVLTYTGERKRREIVMKKKVVGMLLCCVLALSLAGCGKGQESAETKGEETTEVGENEQKESSKDTSTEEISGVIGGVYLGDGELATIPMGTCIDGEQVNLVNVELPLDDPFGASYVEEDGDGGNFLNTSGTLATALELNFLDEPYVAQSIIIGNGSDEINYYVCDNKSYLDMKSNIQTNDEYSDYKEIENGQAFYYVDNREYIKDDLRVVYNIKEDYYLLVTYRGPLAEKLGIDQLAQNICNLITVIE